LSVCRAWLFGMSIRSLPAPRSACTLLRALDRELGDLDDVLWAARESTELLESVAAVQVLRAHLHAVEAGLLAEIEARDVARTELHWASTGEWFAHLAGLRRGAGKRTVDNAVVLASERAATFAALRDGVVSPEQAAVVIDAVDGLPGSVELRERGERVLLTEATRLNATDLDRVGRHLGELVDPSGCARRAEAELDRGERVAHQRRFLSISDDGAGGMRIRGRGSVEDGATLRAALLPLTAPTPSVDAATGEQLADHRDHGTRMFDAMVGLAQHSLDTRLAPASHGARPRVAVAVHLDDLQGRLRSGGTAATMSAVTETGEDLSAATVRRLACDADLIPVVLGTVEEILDVGRSARLVTPAIWKGLVVRDRHCRFPGCRRPPLMCHAHHIVHWADGGSTNLDNLVMLCGHHHRVLHHTPWHVELGPDRRPVFVGPERSSAVTDHADGTRSRAAPRRE
jgi:Domain of unknown function (DUF222)/HNH endonuclease